MKKIILALFIFLAVNVKAAAYVWDIKDGISLINNKNFDKAQKFFEGYIANNPNDSEGHYYLAICYKEKNKQKESIFHFQKSYELSRNVTPVVFKEKTNQSLEDDYVDMANMYLESKDYVKAVQYADMAEKVNSENTDALIIKASAYENMQNKTLAAVYFKKALFVDADLIKLPLAKKLNINTLPSYDFDYYNSKGLEYYYKGDTKAAVDYFNKALKLKPKSASIYNSIALCHIKQNEYKLAKEALNAAKRADKNYSQTYVNLAKLEDLKSDNKGNVKKYLEKAIKVNPNDKYAYFELGNFYFSAKDYNNALEHYKNASMLDSSFYEAFVSIGICYMEQGRLTDALRYLRQAGAINPNKGENADMLYYLAKICILNSDPDEARNYLIKAISKNENSNYYIELGKIYYYKEDYPSAITAFNKALELDMEFENEGEIYNYLGLCNYKNFDTDKALYAFKKAVELEPTRAMYLYNLAQVYKSVDENDMYTKTINSINRVRPKNADDYIDLSTIHFDRKQASEAFRYLDEGIAKYPSERSLYEAKLKLLKTTRNKASYDELQRKMKTLFN